jgi:hypothetical protein
MDPALMLTVGGAMAAAIGVLFWQLMASKDKGAASKDEVIATLREAAKVASERQAQVETSDRLKAEGQAAMTRAVEALTARLERLDESVRLNTVAINANREDDRAILLRRSSTNIPAVKAAGGE